MKSLLTKSLLTFCFLCFFWDDASAGFLCDGAKTSLNSKASLLEKNEERLSEALREVEISNPGLTFNASLVSAGLSPSIYVSANSSIDSVSSSRNQTLFQAASVSKVVASWAVLRYLRQRGISPNDEVIVPESLELAKQGFRATWSQILSHTAGLSVPGYAGFGPDETVQSTLQSLLGAQDASDEPLSFQSKPTREWRYSGGGFTLLQYIIELSTNESFSSFSKREILTPLGLRRSEFVTTPSKFLLGESSPSENGPSRGFSALAAAGFETSIEELSEFVQAHMLGPCGEDIGRGVLPSEDLALLLTPQNNSENNILFSRSYFGNGVALFPQSNKTYIAYHPGDNLPDWHSLVMFSIDRGLGFVFLSKGRTGREARLNAACAWLRIFEFELPVECRKY